MIDSSRRNFLTGAAAVATSLLLPASSVFASGNADRVSAFHALMRQRGINSRTLWLRRRQSNEEVRLQYAVGDKVLRQGYLQAVKIMRDVRANEVKAIDPKLLDLMSAIQAWLAINGHTVPLDILSGYRSPQTNTSAKGARNSMHLQGKAVDLRIDSIPSRTLQTMARTLQAGGVGVYLDRGFVHLDTGRVRAWSG